MSVRAPRLRRSQTSGPGLGRRRTRSGFRYIDESGRPVHDPETIERIAALVIPPAWTDVWISPHAHGHIQAIGIDQAGRRQYLYHEAWRQKQDKQKFDRALDLAVALPSARRSVTKDLRGPTGSRDRALATGFRLLDSARLRVGSERFALEHGSHGLTTLLCEHATVSGSTVSLEFPGKSGQAWSSDTTDDDLAKVIRSLKSRGGDARLLAWKNGRDWRPLSAQDMNDYVRLRTNGDFTAKDFRTLHGSIIAARALRDFGVVTSARQQAKIITAAVAETADALGNTPTVARSSYIDPRVIDRYRHGEVLDGNGQPEPALRRLILGS
ncbi:DNA topoisomerase IB [Mycetocola zhujimingii]|uniref:DNA topoisomerase n=1 Tax=Mycetocola zhujimingii TaxID=2079792 RepID=A0A2U1TGF0_9MICO|nr:DNA topoisomerase IB [Mycetocola zhujimingii]PWC07968.1 DNA topoisomerase [Mycetocola zhujimingii]